MILICYGTRPELIKLFPLVNEMKKRNIPYQTLFTGQHKHLIKEYSHLIDRPTYKFNVFKKGQTLDKLYSKILNRACKLFEKNKFEFVVIQGDTTSSLAIAHSAFHNKIKIAHIEAGLRTFNKLSPFPEEMNRVILSRLADIHFTPTKKACLNLMKENITSKDIHYVGNTIADAIDSFNLDISFDNFILITLHRRENWGKNITNLLKSINSCALRYPNVNFVYISHPNFKEQIVNYLNQHNIEIINPVNYKTMLSLISSCKFIITDSGGIQEEAMCLEKRVMICRDTTERQEVIDNGFGELVNYTHLAKRFDYFYNNYKIQSINKHPYGKDVSKKIVNILLHRCK